MNMQYKNFFILNYDSTKIGSFTQSLIRSVIIVNLITPILMALYLYGIINSIYLFSWLFLQILVLIIRVYFNSKLQNSFEHSERENIKKYLNYYLVTVALAGLLWGIIFSISITQSSTIYAFFLMTLVFAISAGSMTTLSSVYMAVFLFNILMIIPVVFALVFKDFGILYHVEALLLCIFLFSTLRMSYKREIYENANEANLSLINQYEEITNFSSIISKTNPKGIITHVNENFCTISGYKENELLGKSHNIVRHPDMPDRTFEEMWDTIKNQKKAWKGIVKNKAKNGDAYYLNATVSPIFDINGNIKEYISLRHDISAIMSDKKQLFDYLESNKLNVLIMIQIEDYNTLEKFYDKTTVDNIEKVFGDAILHLLPNDCSFQRVYYIGNGMYAIAKDRRTCQKSQEELEDMLQRFLKNVKDYVIKLDKIEYDISVICSYTYGVIQTYEDARIGIEKAIVNKKTIVYADGLSGVEYAIALANIETLHVLKVALDDKKVISFFQPIVNNLTKKVEKYESLVRLINEKGEIISPFAFLDVAKKGRYYNQVTKIVLQNSFSSLLRTDKEISINLSPLDIESEDIQIVIFNLMDKYKEHVHRIVFELLESEDVKDFSTVVDFIKKVKPFGIKIAIDDFGSGYSNFERLLQYEPDLLKIDGSLIKNIKTNKLSKNIVETIVLFAQKQKIKTIAEFVENEDIFNIVKDLGIDYSQGYAFGKPEELMKD